MHLRVFERRLKQHLLSFSRPSVLILNFIYPLLAVIATWTKLSSLWLIECVINYEYVWFWISDFVFSSIFFFPVKLCSGWTRCGSCHREAQVWKRIYWRWPIHCSRFHPVLELYWSKKRKNGSQYQLWILLWRLVCCYSQNMYSFFGSVRSIACKVLMPVAE